MELETKQHNILKEIFDCLGNYTDEVNINFDNIGISINCIDRSNIAVIRVKLLKLIFTKFEFKEGETITVMLPELNKFLKMLKMDDTLNIKELNDMLIITINNNKKFSLGLLNKVEESFKEDKIIDFDIEIPIDKNKTCEYIDNLSTLGGGLNFKLDNKKLILSKDEQKTKGEITLKDNIDNDKKISSTYTDKYIINYNPIIRLGNLLTLKFGNDSPIILISELKNCFRAEFVLAPMVDNK